MRSAVSKRLFLLLFALAGAASNIWAADDAQGLALINRAAELSRLESTNGQPFELTARFRALHLAKGDKQGTYLLLWSPSDQSRIEVKLAQFEMIRVTSADKAWTLRNLDFSPQPVVSLLDVFNQIVQLRIKAGEQISRVRSEKCDDGGCKCVQLTRDIYPNQREMCFDEGSGTLVAIVTRDQTFKYSEFENFNGKKFPHTLRVYDQGQLMVDVQLHELTLGVSLRPAEFTAPPRATETGWCDNPAGGKAIKRIQPSYPPELRQAGIQGSTTLYATITKDGSVGKIGVLKTAGEGLDRSAMDAVRQWKYEPFNCNGVPVEIETQVTVNFTLQHWPSRALLRLEDVRAQDSGGVHR